MSMKENRERTVPQLQFLAPLPKCLGKALAGKDERPGYVGHGNFFGDPGSALSAAKRAAISSIKSLIPPLAPERCKIPV